MKYTLLAADDEKAIHDLIGRTFDPGRYQVLDVFKGDEVLPKALRERPDLILLDIRMPGKNGREVLLELRADARTRMIPVLIVTGDHEGTLAEEEGLRLGADDYVQKPFNPAVLKARVDGVLRRSERSLSLLTRLPGAAAVEHELRWRRERKEPFDVAYLDIDGFKGYNEAKGREAGDALLQDLADVLRDTAFRSKDVFVGHLGEDDFIVLTAPGAAEALVEDLITKFRAWVSTLALSVVITSTKDRGFDHDAEIMELVKRFRAVLKERKEGGRSVYIKDRARP